MTPTALLAELRQRGVALAAAGDRLRVDAPRGVLTPDLREALARHKEGLLRLLADSDRVPGHRDAAGVKSGALAPPPGPRLAPGCLYDYAPGRRVRPLLRCVAHPGCPRKVVLWRDGILAEMFSLERLVGAARRDGEAEWLARSGGAS